MNRTPSRWPLEGCGVSQIRAQAAKAQATIYFAHEAGIRSDDHAGTTWAPSARPRWSLPLGPPSGQPHLGGDPGRDAALCTIDGKLDAAKFIDFCRKLLHYTPGPVFLVIDRYPVHRSSAVREFAASMKGRLWLWFLPPYSPELNPDEMGLPQCEFHRASRA